MYTSNIKHSPTKENYFNFIEVIPKEIKKRENIKGDKKSNIGKHQIFYKYGITEEQHLQMYKDQVDKCKICERHKSEFFDRLVIDHCHTSGKVRELLCTRCNLMLGMATDNINILKIAINYLKEHSVETNILDYQAVNKIEIIFK